MTNTTDQSHARGGGIPILSPLFRLLTSVRFGITLLIILFVYCTIGSAGLLYPTPRGWKHDMIRQHRIFELTEFDWFHTWFFFANIALMCLNMTLVTILKIPFNALKAGVWMIHTGIIILCVGSVIYFSTKIEGDTPVLRRTVGINVEGIEAQPLPALEGARTAIDTPRGTFSFQIASITPDWPILSGADEGTRVFSVNVNVTPPDGAPYTRQLLDGFPQYTEDVVPGQGRAKNIESIGRTIIDDAVEMSLAPGVQDTFWIRDTSAIYIREEGTREWHMRPISNLPRYNEYIDSYEEIAWTDGAVVPNTIPLDPISVPVKPSGADDPIPDLSFRVTGYLRYAVMKPVYTAGGSVTNPVARLRLILTNGAVRTRDLVAFDPSRNSAFDGSIAFSWINDKAALERFREPATATLTFRLTETGERFELPIPRDYASITDPSPLGDSGFSYRVAEIIENLPMPTSESGSVSLAVVEITTPDGATFSRWVFADPSMNRDIPIGAEGAPMHSAGSTDPRLTARYTPPAGGSVPIRVVSGPGDIGTHLVIDNTTLAVGGAEPVSISPLVPGGSVTLPAGITIGLDEIIVNARERMKPIVIPKEQRDRNTDTALLRSMVQVEIARGDLVGRSWLPFHGYSIEGNEFAVLNSGQYNPTPFVLEDGRRFEMIYSRQRMDLPAPVQLDDFIVTTHIGGLSPRDSRSIRDWTSEVSFVEGGTPLDGQSISTNAPAAHGGYWFFQRTWDPNGQRYTGLGVGNRKGVVTQLVGCCIAVVGMLYTFYLKPIIRRKRRERVLNSLEPHAAPSSQEATA